MEGPKIIIHVPYRPADADANTVAELVLDIENARTLRDWLNLNLPPRRRVVPAKKPKAGK